MSIQKLTYGLCKTVLKSSNREAIKKLILAISFSNDCVVFRQTLRSISYPKLQFLGYLLVNQNETEENINLTQSLAILENDQIRLLASCHQQLVNLNKSCISKIVEKFPQAELALSPFNVHKYNEEPFDENFELFDNEFANNVVTAFQDHPAVAVFFETLDKMDEKIDEGHYLSDVTGFSKDLIKSTPFNKPDWLLSTREMSQNHHHRHMLSLVCLRDSLSNMNQLIFQKAAEIEDTLIVFDENNVIDLSPTYNNEICGSLRVTCQTDLSFTLRVEPLTSNIGTLVFLKDVNGYKGMQLGRVEASKSTILPGSGQFDIRLIDENLNSFPFLLDKWDW
jgi:hypothetical protein